jgi:Na+-driven multidrug efflux pump
MQNKKKLFGTQDMTVGKPLHNLAAFSIPLLIGNLAQQMYNTVDSIVVGQYCGDSALAAVGASTPIINLLLLLFMGSSALGEGISAGKYPLYSVYADRVYKYLPLRRFDGDK